MKSLKLYVEQYNKWEAIFGGEPLEFPTTHKECMPLFSKLVGELSPENLCCDGELSHTAVMKKSRHLHSVWKNLETIFGRKVTESEVYDWEANN